MGFWDIFTGNRQADDARAGAGWGIKQIGAGEQEALAEYDQGFGQAQNRLMPYAQSGEAALGYRDDLLGLNGADALNNALMNNPVYSGQLNLMLRNADRASNARGFGSGYDSGVAALAGQRATMQGYQNILAPYMQAAQQGAAISDQMGSRDALLGQMRGDTRYGTNQLQANLRMGGINASNNAKTGGVNNLLGTVGLATKALGGGGLFGSKGLFG